MRQLRHLSEYLLGDQMDAAVLRPQVDLALKPGGTDLEANNRIAIGAGTGDGATATSTAAATPVIRRGHGAVGAAAPYIAIPADALLDPAAAATSSAGAASSTAAAGRFRCAGVWITAATATSLAASSAASLVAGSSRSRSRSRYCSCS